jgi:hypothetical protein
MSDAIVGQRKAMAMGEKLDGKKLPQGTPQPTKNTTGGVLYGNKSSTKTGK